MPFVFFFLTVAQTVDAVFLFLFFCRVNVFFLTVAQTVDAVFLYLFFCRVNVFFLPFAGLGVYHGFFVLCLLLQSGNFFLSLFIHSFFSPDY